MNPGTYPHLNRLIDQTVNAALPPKELPKGAEFPGDPVAVPTDLVREVCESPELNLDPRFCVVEIGGPKVPGFTNLTMTRINP